MPQQPDYALNAAPVPVATADPSIAGAIAGIHAAQIHQTIETLVGFGTRNTLTTAETDLPAGRGAQAAADWIFAEFTPHLRRLRQLPRSQARQLHTQEPDAGPRSRVSKPTPMTNVYAILRGSNPVQAKRIVLVTGHYDSINSNVFKSWADTSGDAPGANDDASGVAVSIECARALSKLHLGATIVFAAVTRRRRGPLRLSASRQTGQRRGLAGRKWENRGRSQ